MWNAASIAEALHHAKDYGFNAPSTIEFDWNYLKQKRDAYITRLNGIYETNMKKDEIDLVRGWASFVDAKKIRVNDQLFTAEHILIASGSKAWIPDNPGCREFGECFTDFKSSDLERHDERWFLWIGTHAEKGCHGRRWLYCC